MAINFKQIFRTLMTLKIRLSVSLSRHILSSQVLVLILTLLISTFSIRFSHSADVTLAWDHSDPLSVMGYYVYYGPESGNYSAKIDAGSEPQYTIIGIDDLKSYYVAVTAYNEFGESDFSGELIYASYACDADIDFDSDIDGADLALYAEDATGIDIQTFIAKFGHVDCP